MPTHWAHILGWSQYQDKNPVPTKQLDKNIFLYIKIIVKYPYGAINFNNAYLLPSVSLNVMGLEKDTGLGLEKATTQLMV